MKQFATDVFVLFFISAIISFLMPWWGIMLVGFLFGLLTRRKIARLLFHVFTAVFLLWAGVAIYIHIVNEGVLAHRLANLINLPASWMMVLITGLIGSVAASTSSLSGHYLRKLIKGKKRLNIRQEGRVSG